MWQIATGVQLDSQESKMALFLRSPYLEMTKWPVDSSHNVIDAEKSKMLQDSVTWIEKLKSPRIIKSHLPMAMMYLPCVGSILVPVHPISPWRPALSNHAMLVWCGVGVGQT